MFKTKIKNLALIPFVYAATSQDGWQVPQVKGMPDRSVAEIMLTFIDWAVMIIGVLGVIIFIYGGFIYLTAQGETNKIDQAKKIILYAIVGIAVSILGLVAVRTIDSIMKGNVPQGGGTASSPTSPSSGSNPGGGPYAMPAPPSPGAGNNSQDVPTSLPSAPMQ